MICPSCGSEIPDGSESCFICGEQIKKIQPSYGGGQYGGGAAPSYYADRYGDPNNNATILENSGRSLDKKTYRLIIGGLLALVVVIICMIMARTGFFANKDGVYRSDDLERAFNDYIDSMGLGGSPQVSGMKCECTLTVTGGTYTIYMSVALKGEMIYEDSGSGSISFFGSSVTFDSGMHDGERGTYDHSNKTITISIDDPEMKSIGLDKIVFTRE
jgi:hypothetical protein